jgi:ABC-type antimicrobial peptide transport system permease subunit
VIRTGIMGEIVEMAMDSLKTHKLRSFLTLLGIMIGVMTVIGMVSIIEGLNKSFVRELESAVISGLGGAIGIVLGFIVARVVSAATSMPSSVEPASIVLAMVMSWSIGLFFGIYPANRAAKLDPVEALRAEQ